MPLGGRRTAVADSDWPALEVLVAMFSDQLAFELREQQGLAYSLGAGVGAAVDGGKLAAVTVSMGTRQANLDTAAAGIREQMARFAQARFRSRQLAKTVNRLKRPDPDAKLSRPQPILLHGVGGYCRTVRLITTGGAWIDSGRLAWKTSAGPVTPLPSGRVRLGPGGIGGVRSRGNGSTGFDWKSQIESARLRTA